MLDTSAIRARLDAATPGPWEICSIACIVNQYHASVVDQNSKLIFFHDANWPMSPGDITLIAHAPTDIAALLKENRKLRLKARLVDRLPFCPDHRDKAQGKSCRECEIERLEEVVEKLRESCRLHKVYYEAGGYRNDLLALKAIRIAEVATPTPQEDTP